MIRENVNIRISRLDSDHLEWKIALWVDSSCYITILIRLRWKTSEFDKSSSTIIWAIATDFLDSRSLMPFLWWVSLKIHHCFHLKICLLQNFKAFFRFLRIHQVSSYLVTSKKVYKIYYVKKRESRDKAACKRWEKASHLEFREFG